MLYLITHGFREGGADNPDPVHSSRGFDLFGPNLDPNAFGNEKSVVSIIDHINPPLVVVGEGRRFIETYLFFKNLCMFLRTTPVKFSQFFGTSVARDDRNDVVILPDGTQIPKGDYLGMSGLKVDWWKLLLAPLPKRTIIFSGRPLMDALGAKESHSGSLYVLDRCHKAIYCVIRRGKRVESVLVT